MGVANSKLEKALVDLPDDEKYFGLENFGNTCYCNSVLQALYFCKPFREQLLLYAERLPCEGEENLLTTLADLFLQISTQKKKTGVIQPKRFVQRVKRDNELFRSYMHQDAHEFLNFLLNEAHEILDKQARERQAATRLKTHGPTAAFAQGAPLPPAHKTWVQEVFQGRWVNETRCLRCETVTSREETFFEWSLETEPHASVTSCLKNFSSTEMLDGDNKFFCDACGCLQEAQKRIRCKELPMVLCLHLKRFFINPEDGRMRKLTHRVVFPFELKLSGDAGDVAYDLFAVVVHVGGGSITSMPPPGHYVSLVKSANTWLYFDDDQVEPIQEHMVQSTFGASSDMGNVEHGYILLYQQRGAA